MAEANNMSLNLHLKGEKAQTTAGVSRNLHEFTEKKLEQLIQLPHRKKTPEENLHSQLRVCRLTSSYGFVLRFHLKLILRDIY